MDTRWFKEDRALPESEQKDAKEESEKALKNATFIKRRLTRILEEEIEKTYLLEEDVDKPGYKKRVLASAARRKAFKEVTNLIK